MSKAERQFKLDRKISAEISDLVISFLLMELMIYDTDNLPDKAKDDWSLGFVAGIIDTIFKDSNMDINSVAGGMTMILVYTRIFGDSSYAATSQLLLKTKGFDFCIGMDAGIRDFSYAANGEIPRAWFDHIKED